MDVITNSAMNTIMEVNTAMDVTVERYNYKFINACKNNGVDAIKYFIDVLKVDHVSNNGFYFACKYNGIDVIKYFIDVLKVDYKSGKEFRWACRYNSAEVIRYFIDVLKVDHVSNNGFYFACKYNGVDAIKYFIDVLKVDPFNGFVYACQYNGVDVIRYFIEEYRAYTSDGFVCACRYNKSVGVIKYFVDDCKEDPKYGFENACGFNESVYIIRYFIEEHRADTSDGFVYACQYNKSVNIIRYFIEEHRADPANGFLNACRFNKSVNIIRYFIDQLKAATYIGFYAACMFNSSTDVIRYFIEDLKVDPHKSDERCNNSFEYVCHFNPSFEIFKYFIEELKIDINKRGGGILCHTPSFLLACHKERNMNIIRYFIDVLKVGVEMCDDYEDNIIDHANENNDHELIKYIVFYTNYMVVGNPGRVIDYAKKNNDQELIKYVINNSKYLIKSYNTEDAIYIDNVHTLQRNENRWNDAKYCKDHYIDPEQIILLYNHVNQLLLTKEQIIKYNIVDPFTSSMEWNVFRSKVDYVKRINKSHDHVLSGDRLNDDVLKRSDDEKIFTNNGIQYYGNRSIVYSQMVPLKCILEMNTDEGFDINQNISDYAMKLYLSKIVQSVNIFCSFDKKDFIGYIRFLDQYPLPNYTIKSIEIDILEYMINNQIPADYYIYDIIERYTLRYMYAWTRNKLNCN